jgi:HEAT repeat protein
MSPKTKEPRPVPDGLAVRSQLQKILATKPFKKRAGEFLRHVVERELAGDRDSLSEKNIGVDVCKRDPKSYSPDEDNIVRVEAGKLRGKLAQYYLAQVPSSDTVLIDIPAGGYAPTFSWVADPYNATLQQLPSTLAEEATASERITTIAEKSFDADHSMPYLEALTKSLTSGLQVGPDLYVERNVKRWIPPTWGRTVERDSSPEDADAISQPLDSILVSTPKAILLGGPGSGKSTALKQLVLSKLARAKAAAAECHDAAPIDLPVLIDLKYLASVPTTVEALLEHTIQNVLEAHRPLSRRVAATNILASQTPLSLFVDGLNEVPTSLYAPMVGLLRRILTTDHHVTITCRTHDYDSTLSDLATPLELEQFTPDDTRRYTTHALGDPTIATRFLNSHFHVTFALLQIPLFLSMACDLLRHMTVDKLLSRKTILLHEFVRTAPLRYVQKGFRNTVAFDRVISLLGHLAFLMFREGRDVLPLKTAHAALMVAGDDLEHILTQAKAWGLMLTDATCGEPLEFRHSLIKAYLCALWLNDTLTGTARFAPIINYYHVDTHWSDCITMLAAIAPDGSQLIDAVVRSALTSRNINTELLACFCVYECAPHARAELTTSIFSTLLTVINSGTVEEARFALDWLVADFGTEAVPPCTELLRKRRWELGEGLLYVFVKYPQDELLPLLLEVLDGGVQRKSSRAFSFLKWPLPPRESPDSVRPSDALRARAVTALATLQRKGDVIPPIVAALSDKSSVVRRAALRALDSLGVLPADALLQAVRNLIGLIDSKDTAITTAARASLLRLLSTEPASAATIISALTNTSNSVDVRHTSARLLGHLHTPASTDALLSAATDSEVGLRRVALQQLGEREDPRVDATLITLLNSPDPKMRATGANGAVKRHKCSPELLQVLVTSLADEHPSVREEAKSALARVGTPAVSPLIQLLSSDVNAIRQSAKTVLEHIGQPAVTLLLASLEQTPEAAYAAAIIRTLGGIGASEATAALVAQLGSPHSTVIVAAVTALRTIGADDARESIARLSEHNSKDVRFEVGRFLLQYEDTRAISCLVSVLGGRELCGYLAMHDLVKIGTAAGKDVMRVLQSEDPTARKQAAFCLGKLGYAPAINILQHLVEHDTGKAADGQLVKEAARKALQDIIHPFSQIETEEA